MGPDKLPAGHPAGQRERCWGTTGHSEPLTAAVRAIAAAADVPVSLHLDHVENANCWRRADRRVLVGDGRRVRCPCENVADDRGCRCAGCTPEDVFVEAELGTSAARTLKPSARMPPVLRTDPRQAAEFVADTRVDALAVAVGSSHAMTSQTATLDFGLIEALRDAVPVPLVLHGSPACADADLATAAVRAGVVKVNIGTALNVAFTSARPAQSRHRYVR